MAIEYIPFAHLLKEVVDNRGKTCPTSPGGIPLIATNCVRNDLLYPAHDKVRFVSEQTYRTWFRGHPKPGDLIFVTKGTPGRVCLAPDPVNFCIAQDMVAATPDERKVYPKYLFALLRSHSVQNLIEQMHVGTLIPHFKKGDFDKLQLPVPSAQKQRVIGDTYFELSAKIELNRKMNETLEVIARAIFKSWFVDFDPVRAKTEGRQPIGMDVTTAALFPDSLENSELGEIPKGWKIGDFGGVTSNVKDAIRPADIAPDTPYIALKHMPRKCLSLDTWEKSADVASNKYQFKKGDTLFGKLRPYFHKVGIAPLDGVCSTDIVVLRGKSPGWSNFVLQVASSEEFVAYNDAVSSGTKMPRTNWPDMSRYKIVVPPVPIASAFNELVAPMIDCLVSRIHESRTLAEIRDTLLPKLMSGEIAVGCQESPVYKST